MHDPSNNGDVRIGFYICHCGHNIAGMVDCAAVAEHIGRLPGVAVSRDYKYMCSDPGQALIGQDIRDHRINRIVVASCSPLLHEHTFRKAVEAGGLNPFFFQMVNIREHDSWVHTDRAEATEKAKALAQAAVRRVRFHRALQTTKVPIHPDVLVVGGGIAGIHAALTLANGGKNVYLVEREPSIGGHMAKFDKTFPTLDCAACILTPKMSAVRAHENITLWTYSDVVKVEGYVGNYTVTIRRRPRYINEELCVGCQECIKACIYKEAKFPDEFNVGLSKRKPIYIPFPQAVPQVVVIDPERCLQIKSGKCKRTCIEACADRQAIDFTQKEETVQVKVGNIILATGFKLFDAKRIPQYGYGRYPNVVTSLELERLVTSSGPTGGELVLRDGSTPRSVGFILCVGSRDFKTNRWCSRTCCMHSMKLAQLVREHTGADVTVFYLDIRAPGKGCEEFYDKSLKDGIQFVRGRVAEVTDWALTPEEEGKLVIRAEDTLAGVVRRIPVDMIVLAVGMEPHADVQQVRRLFNMSCGTEGWFLEKHPKLAPVSTFTDGVFIAGCCQGPKDIPDSIAQAGAAAAEAMALIDRGFIEQEPNTAYIVEEDCSGCKSCVALCPYTAISFDDAKQKAAINAALCKGCGTCVAACPSGSIRQHLFEDDEIFSEIEGVLTHA
jgi:heterodisulfide reductase subunit A2